MIIGFYGRRGKGKTLSATRLIKAYKEEGYKVFTNTPFKFEHEIITKQMLIDYYNTDTNFDKAIFFLDEAHMFLDSRRGTSGLSLIITYFVLQTRKRGVKLIYTTQDKDQVDKRLRQQTEVDVYCDIHDYKGKKVIQNDIHEGEVFKKRLFFIADDYYDMYDTTKLIK